MLKTESVSVKIEDKFIVENISFNASKAEFISLIGPNGSGKSTIIKAISKLLPVENGKILLMDKEIGNYKAKAYAQVLSTMCQHGKAVEELTVYDMVAYGRIPYKNLFTPLSDKDNEIINQVLELVELSHFKDRSVGNLSGGEFQRVYLASCLAQEPEVLILDEPTNHLDIRHQYKILSLVKKYAKEKGLTVVCVLHDINQAIKFSDRVIIMKNGSIQHCGTPEEVITEDIISYIYGIKIKLHYDEHGMHIDFLESF